MKLFHARHYTWTNVPNATSKFAAIFFLTVLSRFRITGPGFGQLSNGVSEHLAIRRPNMYEMTTRDDMERLERTVQRLFARVSFLEARLNELERDLAAQAVTDGVERSRIVEPLRLTA
jgi:hypothetical protein